MSDIIRGKAFVLGDNIDTDQIIPAQHMVLVPTDPQEYRLLGSFALSGLPSDEYPTRLVTDGEAPSEYAVVIAGRNFGCGSSREHALIALGAAGIRAVVAESFARIFFRNCLATGELYPIESADRLCDLVKTGREVELDLDAEVLRLAGGPGEFKLRPLGQAREVVSAGGLFEFARRSGLIGGK